MGQTGGGGLHLASGQWSGHLGQAGRAEGSDPVREEEGSTVWACRDGMGSPPPPVSLSQDVPVPQLPGAGGC